jgi:ferrous iron transport protein B
MRGLALVGNPNVGKTAVFNALTGLSQSTGNYAGVTVERKHGRFLHGKVTAEIIDLPGAYSLSARSPDEAIVTDVLLGQRAEERPLDGIVVIVDASNLERNLYFVSQLLELELPAIVVLNMMDIAKRRGIEIDTDRLSQALCGVPVVAVCAHRRVGMDTLREAVARLATGDVPPMRGCCEFPAPHRNAVAALAASLGAEEARLGRRVPLIEAHRVLVDVGGYSEERIARKLGKPFTESLARLREEALDQGVALPVQEANTRYRWVRGVMDQAVRRPAGRIRSRSERIDDVLTHKLAGSAIFVLVMLIIFQGIYTWAGPVMDLVDGVVGAAGAWAAARIPEGMLQSLVVDGVIAGVGAVLIFLPQILLLSLFIAVLEDFGYMARAAFLMDKLLGWCGLSGQSFIPMLTSFACAIPGILATRTIHHRRDRFTTILVAPLMSCSARLPVYVIMIAAFVPDTPLVGSLLTLQGLTLFLMYGLGVAVAVPMAWLFKRTFFKGEKPPFILEMPSYKVPQARSVFFKVYREGREFVSRAGTLIFAVTIVVWALAYFPQSTAITEAFDAQRAAAETAAMAPEALEEALADLDRKEAGEHLRNSVLGRMGRLVEPAFVPLGWDWRIATATIASFPAREIIVATMGTLFNLGGDVDETSPSLIDTLRAATWPDGRTLFTLPVALSIMVFFALCCQCGATLVTIKRETGQWRWPAITFGYMTALAYLAALLTYQGASRILG